jgi:hypothetical protein
MRRAFLLTSRSGLIASPGTAEYYRKNGKFPDGAVLVKEVFGTEHAQLTTGDSHWASGTKVWFVKIKDDRHRFPQNALWGVDADGHFSRPTPPISRWQLITKKIASAVTYRLSRPTGHTSKVFRFSARSKQHDSSQEFVCQSIA